MTEPCSSEKRLETIERRYDNLSDVIKKMEDKFDAKLDMILYQINKVAILEEKHTYQSAALTRAFDHLKDLDTEVKILQDFKNKTEGMAKMAWLLWSAMGLSLAAIITKVY